MNNMSLRKIMRFNHLMERVLAKQLNRDDLEYLALRKQWNEAFNNKSIND